MDASDASHGKTTTVDSSSKSVCCVIALELIEHILLYNTFEQSLDSCILYYERVLRRCQEFESVLSLVENFKRVAVHSLNEKNKNMVEQDDQLDGPFESTYSSSKQMALYRWIVTKGRRHHTLRYERIKKCIHQQWGLKRCHDIQRSSKCESKQRLEELEYMEEFRERWQFLSQKNENYIQVVEDYQHQLIRELLYVFHVKLNDPLPSLRGFLIFSFNEYVRRATKAKSGEAVLLGTSLGFLAHFLQILAKYLNIPLFKKIILFSSMTRLGWNDDTAHLNEFHCKTRIPPLTTDVECPKLSSNVPSESVTSNDNDEDTLRLASFPVGSQSLWDEESGQWNKMVPLSEHLPSDFMVCVRSRPLHQAYKTTPTLTKQSSNLDINHFERNDTILDAEHDETRDDHVAASNDEVNSSRLITFSDQRPGAPTSPRTLEQNLSSFSKPTTPCQVSTGTNSSCVSDSEYLPLFLKSSSEVDRALFIRGLRSLRNLIDEFITCYESIHHCNIFKYEGPEYKTGGNAEDDRETKPTKEKPSKCSDTQSLFEPLRRLLVFEFNSKKSTL